MQVEMKYATIWRKNERNGKLSINVTDSNKNQDGTYETNNSFWANVAGEAAEYVKTLSPSTDGKTPIGRATFSGFENGRGKKLEDGSYGQGWITFTKVEPLEMKSGSGASQTGQTASAPSVSTEFDPMDDEDELPFN